MNPDQARAKVAKLRAHATSVAGTPEADLFNAKADELAKEHGVPHISEPAPVPPPKTPRSTGTPPGSTARTRTTHARRTSTMTGPSTTAKPSRPASDGTLRDAFTPRTRAAFGRNTAPGTAVAGYIVAIVEEPDLDFYSKAPKLNPDGTQQMVPVLIIQTDGGTKPYGGGLRKLWMRTGIADAIIGACHDAGTERTAVGGKLRICFEGLGEPPAPNFTAPKLYSATYEPPQQEAGR
ncbi:DUF2786 domain-containing protein [Nocardia huaxiensis]|uniref:DUF2786 domain-containing protein n=1 Tax=Nocardia huaxiensis TaxID=2755382 RepID=A0A7D6ZGI6_9NOCA|nr:DUF2786 domain-containing protein [Nocardia huaxiensis]QLY33278.1 DUF2786 domain-containing protein [Nocardia huaxiensis]